MTAKPLKFIQDADGANALGEFTPGDAIPPEHGGTGLAALGAANQLPGVNAGGTAMESKTIVAGQGTAITHTQNTIIVDVTNQDGNHLINYFLGVK